MNKIFGYARVSTVDQSLDTQIEALEKYGCELFFTETASGAKTERIELGKLLEQVRKGDIVVVYKFDRLGRSLKHLLEVVALLNAKQVGLQSITTLLTLLLLKGAYFLMFWLALQNLKGI